MNTDYYFSFNFFHYRDVSIIKCIKIVICQIYICFSLLNGNFLYSFVLLGNMRDYEMIENYNKNILCRICFSSLMENGKWKFSFFSRITSPIRLLILLRKTNKNFNKNTVYKNF